MSEISRAATPTPMALTLDACMRATGDAGLKRADVDGLSSYPGADNNASGFPRVGVPQSQDALRLDLNCFSGGGEAPGQPGAVFNAIGAIAAGYCRHVLASAPSTRPARAGCRVKQEAQITGQPHISHACTGVYAGLHAAAQFISTAPYTP
jgi:hypothetical protein